MKWLKSKPVSGGRLCFVIRGCDLCAADARRMAL